MKYPAKIYAKAFAEAAHGKHSADNEKKLIRNFLEIIRRNGDGGALPAIFAGAEKMLREKEGLRKLTIETARPLSEKLRKSLHSLAESSDIIEEKVEPKLLAGVRLILNEEKQFDASLDRRLTALFKG